MPSPIFDAPLTSSLVPVTAGNGTPTFTRATTAYVSAVAAAGNAVDGEVLILCDAGEARFAGARRISANNWSPLYADGSAIPASKLLGYVAENAATNLCLQSQTFDNAAWTKENAVIAADNIAAPDGTLTADRFTDNTTSGLHRVYVSVSGATSGQPHTCSLYVKQGTVPWIQIYASTLASLAWANFNLATGAVGNVGSSVTATSAVALPNGWWRLSFTFTTTGTAGLVQIFSIPSNVSAAGDGFPYVGTSQTMYLWGAQVEQSSDPTSYIPTMTVAVTRNVDSLTYSVASNLNAAVGTAYIEGITNLTATGPTRGLIVLDPITSYPLALTNVPAYFVTIYDGSTALATASSPVKGVSFKAASKWVGVTKSVVFNGGAVASDAFDGAMGGTTIVIGNWNNSTPGATLRNVKIYNIALTDAQLIQITTDGFLPPDEVPAVPSAPGGVAARYRRRRIEVEIDGEIFPVASEEEGRELLLKAREAAKQAAQAAAVRAAAKAEKKTSPAAVERALALSTPRISLRADDRSEALAQAIQAQVDAAQAAIDEDYATARRMAYAYVRQRLQDEQRQRELAADEEEVIAMILRLP